MTGAVPTKFRTAVVWTVALFLGGSAALGLVSGCASSPFSPGVRRHYVSDEVNAFFVAGKEADYLGLQCYSPHALDLSAYDRQAGIKYPRTLRVDILTKPPARPFKTFAVLEYVPPASSPPRASLEKLKNKAREIGADALILCQAGSTPELQSLPPGGRVQAVAIKYKWVHN
jgi:hypothetical protein